MNNPAHLKYTASHEWADLVGEGEAVVGLTDFAQHALGDIVFVSLPQVGDSVTSGQVLGEVESVKSVSEVMSPVSGTVLAVNDEVAGDPARVNTHPYDAWLVRLGDVTETGALLDAAAYAALCQEQDS
ncbi:MAG: glycine cleavage system protein GcvH [Propionibacteriaceae bacterium]|jgi:glycine cleavage system H protein|nr:glycine cleavage system protein GcvH [Propionibacteriaceae bacterium]